MSQDAFVNVIHEDYWYVFYPDGKRLSKYQIVTSLGTDEAIIPSRDPPLPVCENRISPGVDLKQQFTEIQYSNTENGSVRPEFMANPDKFINSKKSDILDPFDEIEAISKDYGALYVKMVGQNHFKSLHKTGTRYPQKIMTDLIGKYNQIESSKYSDMSLETKIKRMITHKNKIERDIIENNKKKPTDKLEQPIVLLKKLKLKLLEIIPPAIERSQKKEYKDDKRIDK